MSVMGQESNDVGTDFSLLERSYRLDMRKDFVYSLRRSDALPQSAEFFYRGASPLFQVVEICKSTARLNIFLKGGKESVQAGVPGCFLHAVMRKDHKSDVGSIVSSIMYAFYLSETSDNCEACVVPVINMKRTDLKARTELKWLLDSCQIDHTALVFSDEIDLSYHDLFGSLKVIPLNGNRSIDDSHIPTVHKDSSFCAVVADKFSLTSPDILTGRCFSRFLLAGILLDTSNLSSPNCTSIDKCMATLLINGAGRFGCSGLYQLLRTKMCNVSSLTVADILSKDLKKFLRGKQDCDVSRANPFDVGMSSIGVPIVQLLAHQETSVQDIKCFQLSERLGLLLVVSEYCDAQRNFKMEVLVSSESTQLMKIMLNYLNSRASLLPLKFVPQKGLGDEMRVFDIDKLTSRKTIEGMLEEFGRNSKH